MATSEDLAIEAAYRVASQDDVLINFSDFTKQLLSGVFETLVKANTDQIDTYVKMVSAVSGGPDQFILQTLGNIDQATIKYLNDVVRTTYTDEPTDFELDTSVTSGPPIKLASTAVTVKANQTQALQDSFANLDVTGDGVADALTVTTGTVTRGDLFKFAKAFLTRASRHSFEEIKTLLQMGFSRLVVDEGFVDTAVTFHVDSTDTSERSSTQTETDTANKTRSFVGGIAGGTSGSIASKIFSNTFTRSFGARFNASSTSTSFKVKVVNEKSTKVTHFQSDITGRVHVKFKSDYFPMPPIEQH